MSHAGVLPQPQRRKVAPGPRGHLIWGSLYDFQRDPLRAYMDAAREFGPIVRFRYGPWFSHFLSHPDYVKYVLQDNHPNYRKGFISDSYLKPLLGEGLVTSDGDFWLRQRRLAQPAFHRQRLAAFGTTMTDATVAMLERWQGLAQRRQPLDLSEEMMKLTFTIVGKTLFTADVSALASDVGRAMAVAQEHINYRYSHPFALPEKYPTPRNRRFHQARAVLDRIVYGVIETRRREGGDRGDLLSMLLLARDETTGEGMSDEQLRDEVVTFLLAGHETTSNTLTWTFYLLSKHPSVARQLRAELASVLGGRPPRVEDLPNLKYNLMVIEEAMRLYPPAWALSRGAIAEDEIGGYTIPANSLISMCPWVTHRLPEFWENPEGFDPERFTPERSATRPRYAYFPFGGGPRMCIGNNFALMEAQLLLATIAQAFQLDLVPGCPVEPEPLVTLRPKGGMWMTLR